MKKKWLAALIACFALTITCGLSACGGCSSGNSSNSQSQSSSNGTQSSSLVESSEEVESSEAVESSEETESSEAVESSEIIASSEETESSTEDSSSEEVESSTEDSSSEENEEDEEKTDEEIFAEIKEAVLATQNYNGAFTMKFREDYMGYVEEGDFTINPETLECALIGTEDEEELTSEKYFKKDGKYYGYYLSGDLSDLQSNEADCEELGAKIIKEYQEGYLAYYAPWSLLESYGSFAIADMYTELLEAFAIVAADSRAMLTDYYISGQGDYGIDLGVEDGTSWISFTTSFSCEGSVDEADSPFESRMTIKFVVEDGYVTKLEQIVYAKEMDNEYGYEQDVRTVYEYVYAFDQELFDSIIPCEAKEKTEYRLYANLHLHSNYIDQVYIDITAERTAEDIINELNQDAFWGQPENLNLVMDAWYLDEACTIKFDPNTITDLMEYENITDLYAKSITFSNDYAWIIVENKIEEHYSKPYQITKMFDYTGRAGSMSEPFQPISEPYTLPTGDKVLVDGVEATTETITLETGKTYVITVYEYDKDEEFCLFPRA